MWCRSNAPGFHNLVKTCNSTEKVFPRDYQGISAIYLGNIEGITYASPMERSISSFSSSIRLLAYISSAVSDGCEVVIAVSALLFIGAALKPVALTVH